VIRMALPVALRHLATLGSLNQETTQPLLVAGVVALWLWLAGPVMSGGGGN